MRTFLLVSQSLDPHINLAVEEYLISTLPKDTAILYFYQNEHAIIIGKNQNTWAECACRAFELSGGKIARRITGGGAVYHDKNNLNFSFIFNKYDYNTSRQFSVIVAAMKALGFNAEVSGRNDILIDGRKFSGNAFCLKKETACHHGTILIDTDMEQLAKYLTVSTAKIVSKGIQSVKARVVNLKQLKSDITVEQVKEAITKAFSEEYGVPQPLTLTNEDEYRIDEITARNRSFEWQYGESPEFDVELSDRFSWGCVTVGLNVRDGMIKNAKLYSDALDVDTIQYIADALTGCPFTSSDMEKCVKNAPGDPNIIGDVSVLIAEKNF